MLVLIGRFLLSSRKRADTNPPEAAKLLTVAPINITGLQLYMLSARYLC